MLRLTWKIQFLFVGLICAFNKTAAAQESTDSETDMIGKTIQTLTAAFKGGEEGAAAQSQLIEWAGAACFMLGVLFISYLAASAIGRSIGNMVTKKVDVTLGKFLTKAIRNILMFLVAVVALEVVCKIPLTQFAVVLGAVGFAIGMALQGTLGNFAAGIMLLVFRPFKIDDYIVVAGTEGTVEEIDLFTTRLNALDNRHLIIPNGEIFGAKLENYSRNGLRRVDVNVGAAYSADLDQTRTALKKAADLAASEFPTKGPKANVYLMELGASSVDWQLRVWCEPKNYWDVREILTANAKNQLDRAGIGIPYPQLDVHVGGKLLAKAA